MRAAEVDFTAPYVLIEGTYMVPKDSALKTIEDVDRAGVRIGVNKGSAYDLYLTRTLKNATLLRGDDGVALFKKDKLEAAGGVRQPLEQYARKDPGVRVMDGRFMAIQQAMGMPKGRARAHAYLRGFVEEMKASGFVADALKRSNQPDAVVAPSGQSRVIPAPVSARMTGFFACVAGRACVGRRAAAAVLRLVAGHRLVPCLRPSASSFPSAGVAVPWP